MLRENRLRLLKKHVNADDFTADDALLTHYYEAAEEAVIGMTRRSREELADGGDDLPAELVQASLMLAAHWYNQREAVSTAAAPKEIPYSISTLVSRYRRLV